MTDNDERSGGAFTRREFLSTVPGALATARLWSDIPGAARNLFFGSQPFSMVPMLPRIYLSGISWIDPLPSGVRLRWLFPLRTPDNSGSYLGFPDSVVVQRANLGEVTPILDPDTKIDIGSAPNVRYPNRWWQRGLQMRSLAPAVFVPGQPFVQAITFLYGGKDTRCIVRDSNHCALGEFPIKNAERMYFEAADIGEIEFLCDDARKITLKDDWFLDLYASHELEWRDIATIAVREALLDPNVGSFQNVKNRVYGHATIKPDHWKAIQEHAIAADKIKKVADDDPKLKSPTWDIWLAIQALRWEIATITGYGFVHGPQRNGNVNGDTVHVWLPIPSLSASAYRVVVPKPLTAQLASSNIVVVPLGKAFALQPPEDIRYQHLSCVPTQIIDNFDPQKPSPPRKAYIATGTLTWTHKLDPWAMGIDVTETLTKSPAISKPEDPMPTSFTERIHAHGRHGRDLVGSRNRTFELLFPDCSLVTSARTFDGWDRQSTEVKLADSSFDLAHYPQPPDLACAVMILKVRM